MKIYVMHTPLQDSGPGKNRQDWDDRRAALSYNKTICQIRKEKPY
jgi:hypothetical protein